MTFKLINSVVFQVIICFSLILPSCRNNPQKDNKQKQMVFTDMSNRQVTIPDPINRVISNGLPGTIILYTLAEDMLIARNSKATEGEIRFCTEHYCQLPQIGRWFLNNGSRNTETIIELQPDVLISCGNTDTKAANFANKDQEYLKIPVLQFSTDLSESSETYKMLGKLLGRQQKAEEMNGFMAKYLQPIIDHAKNIPDNQKPRVYIAVGDNGLSTSPQGSIHAQVLDYAGARNAVEVQKTTERVDVNIEQVINWNPDIILTCGSGSVSSLGLEKYIIDKKLWANPEWFPFKLDEVIREFYSIFYHYSMSASEVQSMYDIQ